MYHGPPGSPEPSQGRDKPAASKHKQVASRAKLRGTPTRGPGELRMGTIHIIKLYHGPPGSPTRVADKGQGPSTIITIINIMGTGLGDRDHPTIIPSST